MINEAMEHFKNTSTSNHLVITEDEKFPQVYFDRTRMLDVLISIIEGCIRYSGERGSRIVHVGWRKQDDGPVFFTSCSGTGELKDLSQAFRLSSEEVTGGRMWMECGPEAGYTILFTLSVERRHDCAHACRYLRMHGEGPGDIGKNGGGEGKIKRNRSGEACCDESERGQECADV